MTDLSFPMPTLADTDLHSYIAVMLLITMAVVFGIFNVVASLIIGPRRDGATKSAAYESGMNAIGTARKRFNVRFYMIAMVFLVFDIEIIFLYPWAVTYPNLEHGSSLSLLWLGRILFFVFTTIVAYVYGVRKGVFRFD
ncbi:MAG TPA: NADH-quinone oxidoreductase subunit A [Phycisphaerales bacterium]|jgi:NADH-quinone oxidoreductase subunit A|nr:NADH-quinone oxidoreductase subunit A [Phycisphaerales bacterium]